jgi:hypothetical protein
MLFGGGLLPASSSLNLFLVNVGGALLPSGLVTFARGSGGVGGMTRFVVALLVGLALRDDSSLEESSAEKALFFRLGLLRLDIVPNVDSSLEESSAGACTTFFVDVDVVVVVVGGSKVVAAVEFVAVAELVETAKFVAAAEFVETAKFVAAARADKEGNADVRDVVPTAQVVTRGDADVDIVVVHNGDAIAVAVAARVHAVLVALAVAVCGLKGDSTEDSRMVALQRTGRRWSG